jgi:hypothetical protein
VLGALAAYDDEKGRPRVEVLGQPDRDDDRVWYRDQLDLASAVRVETFVSPRR